MITMREITTYECDFCGQVFDDEAECVHHEWKCRYNDLCGTENCEPLKMWNLEGYEIEGFDYPECDEIGAVEIHSYAWAQFINDYFEDMKNLLKSITELLNVMVFGSMTPNTTMASGGTMKKFLKIF